MFFKNSFSNKRDLKSSIYTQDKHWRNNVACLLQSIPQKQKDKRHNSRQGAC
jgi:hypothetical protein